MMDVAEELHIENDQQVTAPTPDLKIESQIDEHLDSSIYHREKCHTIESRLTSESDEVSGTILQFQNDANQCQPKLQKSTSMTIDEIEVTVKSVGLLLNEFNKDNAAGCCIKTTSS